MIRRDFLKGVAAIAAAPAGVPVERILASADSEDWLRWYYSYDLARPDWYRVGVGFVEIPDGSDRASRTILPPSLPCDIIGFRIDLAADYRPGLQRRWELARGQSLLERFVIFPGNWFEARLGNQAFQMAPAGIELRVTGSPGDLFGLTVCGRGDG